MSEDPTPSSARLGSPPAPDPLGGQPTVEQLREHVVFLERMMLQLVDAVAGTCDEIRTRRLVVVDEHGDERITTQTSDTITRLVVASPVGTRACVSLEAAHGEVDDGTAHAAVNVHASGTTAVSLVAQELSPDRHGLRGDYEGTVEVLGGPSGLDGATLGPGCLAFDQKVAR